MISPLQDVQQLSPSTRALPRGVWFACAMNLLLWLAALVTLPPLLDEIGSWGMGQGSFSQVLEQTIYSQGQGPVYFVILSYWMKLFGDTTTSLRGLSLICSLLTILIMATVARSLKGDRFATRVVWLYVCMPWVACFSPLARPYALANLLLAILFLIAVQFSRSRHKIFLGIGAALSALLFLTQSLYVLALPFSALLVWFAASPASRLRYSLWWLVSLGAAQALVVLGCLPIISHHAGTLADLAYLANPTLNDLFGQLLFDSALGLAALMVFIVSVVLRRSQPLRSDESTRSFLIATTIAALVPIGALWLASNLFSVTLFTPRYLMLTAPFSALAAAALVESTAFCRVNLVGAIVLGAVGLMDTGANLLRQASFQDQLARDIGPLDVTGCSLFVSTGYIDLQIPGRIEDRRMYSFLSAPVTYYKKTEVHLMPNSLDQEPARRYFQEEVLPKILDNACVIVVAYNLGFSAADKVLAPYAATLREQLQAAGFSVALQSRVSDQPNAFVVLRAERTSGSPT